MGNRRVHEAEHVRCIGLDTVGARSGAELSRIQIGRCLTRVTICASPAQAKCLPSIKSILAFIVVNLWLISKVIEEAEYISSTKDNCSNSWRNK